LLRDRGDLHGGDSLADGFDFSRGQRGLQRQPKYGEAKQRGDAHINAERNQAIAVQYAMPA
jgi:hypothetical protein